MSEKPDFLSDRPELKQTTAPFRPKLLNCVRMRMTLEILASRHGRRSGSRRSEGWKEYTFAEGLRPLDVSQVAVAVLARNAFGILWRDYSVQWFVTASFLNRCGDTTALSG